MSTAAQPAPFHLAADPPDHRDYAYLPPAAASLPAALDLRSAAAGFPPVYHQGVLNSCTANAVAAVLAFDIRRQAADDRFDPSRLFIYYNERYAEHKVGLPVYGNHGAPAYMRDAIKTVADTGFCSETDWPYDQSKFDIRPPDPLYHAARHHRGAEYRRIPQDLAAMKACLAEGFPFVCGIVIFSSYREPDVAATGNIPLPAADDAQLGGHGIAVVGYDDTARRFAIRNSFGESWGVHGYGTIPYEFLTDPAMALDFWTIRKVLTPPADGATTR